MNCSLHPGDLGLLNNLPVDLQQLLDSVIPASNHETSRALGLETTENQRNFSKFYPSWLWFQSEWYKKLLEASTFKTKPPILPPVEDHWTYGNSLKLSILQGTFHLQQKTQYHLNFPSSALNCLISLLARHGWWSSKALGKTFAEQQEHDGQQKWELNGENMGIQWDNDGLIMGYMCYTWSFDKSWVVSFFTEIIPSYQHVHATYRYISIFNQGMLAEPLFRSRGASATAFRRLPRKLSPSFRAAGFHFREAILLQSQSEYMRVLVAAQRPRETIDRQIDTTDREIVS